MGGWSKEKLGTRMLSLIEEQGTRFGLFWLLACAWEGFRWLARSSRVLGSCPMGWSGAGRS